MLSSIEYQDLIEVYGTIKKLRQRGAVKPQQERYLINYLSKFIEYAKINNTYELGKLGSIKTMLDRILIKENNQAVKNIMEGVNNRLKGGPLDTRLKTFFEQLLKLLQVVDNSGVIADKLEELQGKPDFSHTQDFSQITDLRELEKALEAELRNMTLTGPQ